MSQLVFDRLGNGPPLVLLHGLGLSRRCWDPVLPALAERFDVIAVDLPGFGDSALLPADVEPAPAALAATVAELLDDLGISDPHLVGNSLGGWVALELAEIRPAASSDASLARWAVARSHPPLLTCHPAGVEMARPPCWWPALPAGQVSRSAGPDTRSVSRPAHAYDGDAGPDNHPCAGALRRFRRHAAAATRDRHYRATADLDAPVSVAFGSRDLVLLRRQSRHLDQLPPNAALQELPGCGHVPMFDDPGAVTALHRGCSAGADRLTRGLPKRRRSRGQCCARLFRCHVCGVPVRPVLVTFPGARLMPAMRSRRATHGAGEVCLGGEHGLSGIDATRQPCRDLLDQPAVAIGVAECGEGAVAVVASHGLVIRSLVSSGWNCAPGVPA